MKTKICSIARFDTVLALVVTATLTASNGSGVGTTAPDFTLKSQDGNPITLSQFRGKWVVLYFYPRDMTSGCTLEAHNFQRDQTSSRRRMRSSSASALTIPSRTRSSAPRKA